MKLPLGIQTFSKIIEDQLLYVDKTAIIHQLIDEGSVYFLSRPPALANPYCYQR